MLLADGSPADKLAINRLGLSQTDVRRKPGPDVQPTKRPVRFGFAGRLHPAKGLAQTVRAVRAIPRDVEFRFDIRAPMLDAGARAFADDLRRLAGDDPRIRFEPAVSLGGDSRRCWPSSTRCCRRRSGSRTVRRSRSKPWPSARRSSRTPRRQSRRADRRRRQRPAGRGRRRRRAVGRDSRKRPPVPATTIDVWRRALPPVRTMDDIARDYLAMYAA